MIHHFRAFEWLVERLCVRLTLTVPLLGPRFLLCIRLEVWSCLWVAGRFAFSAFVFLVFFGCFVCLACFECFECRLTEDSVRIGERRNPDSSWRFWSWRLALRSLAFFQRRAFSTVGGGGSEGAFFATRVADIFEGILFSGFRHLRMQRMGHVMTMRAKTRLEMT